MPNSNYHFEQMTDGSGRYQMVSDADHMVYGRKIKKGERGGTVNDPSRIQDPDGNLWADSDSAITFMKDAGSIVQGIASGPECFILLERTILVGCSISCAFPHTDLVLSNVYANETTFYGQVICRGARFDNSDQYHRVILNRCLLLGTIENGTVIRSSEPAEQENQDDRMMPMCMLEDSVVADGTITDANISRSRLHMVNLTDCAFQDESMSGDTLLTTRSYSCRYLPQKESVSLDEIDPKNCRTCAERDDCVAYRFLIL